MSGFVTSCLAMSGAAALLALALLAVGVPPSVLVVVIAALVCVGLHLALGHGDADGADLFETAQRAARPDRY